MQKILRSNLIMLLFWILLIAFIVVHELGHTILARLLGDPNSTFYLAKIGEDSACCGFTIYDTARLSWGGNLTVSLGGLLATQLVALIALFLLRLRRDNFLWRRTFSIIALGFAFLDVSVQIIQGLLYNLDHHVWPTNVDLMDVMLLLQPKVGASQILFKGLLLTIAVVYLSVFVWAYKQNRKPQTG